MDKIYIIDLREEFEITELRLKPKVDNVEILYIPTRHIFANQDYIRRLAQLGGKVWLLCRSSVRSDGVKSKYFSNDANILSSKGGIKYLCDKEGRKIKYLTSVYIDESLVECVKGYRSFGPQQYMQFIFVVMLILLGVLSLFMERKWFLLVIGVMVLMVLYQGMTKSCWMSTFIPWKV